MDADAVRAMIRAEVSAMLAELNTGMDSRRVEQLVGDRVGIEAFGNQDLRPRLEALEALTGAAHETANRDIKEDIDASLPQLLPLTILPTGGLGARVQNAMVLADAGTAASANFQLAASFTLADNSTNYFWLELTYTRTSFQGVFSTRLTAASVVVNTDGSYDLATNAGDLPGSATLTRVHPIGFVVTNDGAWSSKSQSLYGNLLVGPVESTLPAGTGAGQFLFWTGTEWDLCDNPTTGAIKFWDGVDWVNVVLAENQTLLGNSGSEPEATSTDTFTAITAFQVDTATRKLQIKTRTFRAIAAGTESAWTDVHTGAEC